MNRTKKSSSTLREALAGEALLGFDHVAGTASAKAGTAKSGSGKVAAPWKVSVAKSGKSAAGKLSFLIG